MNEEREKGRREGGREGGRRECQVASKHIHHNYVKCREEK